MNSLLADHGILVDLSCCPGLDAPDREAIWVHAELDAYYLPADPRSPARGERSPVLEIPIGSDGKGSQYPNILHVEQSELDNLERILDEITLRAERAGRPQIVHSLFHTGSMGRADWVERYRRFLGLSLGKGVQMATPSEAKVAFDARAEFAA